MLSNLFKDRYIYLYLEKLQVIRLVTRPISLIFCSIHFLSVLRQLTDHKMEIQGAYFKLIGLVTSLIHSL